MRIKNRKLVTQYSNMINKVIKGNHYRALKRLIEKRKLSANKAFDVYMGTIIRNY